MTEQDYLEAINWLFVQIPSYQDKGEKAYKPGLDNIKTLCQYFGNPQNQLQTIHIAGTNGKGSTSNMFASVLQHAGYKVGLFTSPHLVDFTERIKVNGKNCNREFVYQFIQKLKTLPPKITPSFFEFTTIMAFEYFHQQKVDYAVIEVGLGGRLDSTNIIHPLVCAITNIGLDHMDILGDTKEKIAAEKAGIIKKNVPIVCGDEDPPIKNVIQKVAASQTAPFIDATLKITNYTTDLKGDYQTKNLRVVIGIIEELWKLGVSIPKEAVAYGLSHVVETTGFLGRWTVFSTDPLVICDTAHNEDGLQAVFLQLNAMFQHKHLILGFVNDKKIEHVLEILPPDADYYFVKPSVERGRNPETYEANLKNAKINYKIFQSVQEGYRAAIQNIKKDELIFIGGSNFVVGDFLKKNLHV